MWLPTILISLKYNLNILNIAEEELARELDHSDSNDDDNTDITMEIEEKLLKDEPECKYLYQHYSHYAGLFNYIW